jgi:multidrug efflux pump subunit AcrA (membrane-fusion protein)
MPVARTGLRLNSDRNCRAESNLARDRRNAGFPVSLLLCVSVLILLLAACAEGNTTGQDEPTATPIPTAPAVARPLYTVQRGDVQQILEFSGRWQPRDQVSLAFEVDGIVRRVEVRRDDTVAAGQLLADLNIEDLEQRLQDAEIQMEQALAAQETDAEGVVQTVEQAELEVFNAQLALQRHLDSPPTASVASALEQIESAQRNLERAEQNYREALGGHGQGGAGAVDSAYNAVIDARNAIANAQRSYAQAAASAGETYRNWENTLIDRQNALTLAERNLERARERALRGGTADLRSQQLNIERLQEDIARSTLLSSIDGVVLEVQIQPGDQVRAFQGVITVGIPQPLEIIASLPIGDAQRLSAGLVGVCQALNRPETAVQCVVRQIPASAADADQTTRVAAALDDDIAPGTIIQVQMPLQVREDVLWLPPAAIRTFQNRTFVVLDTPDGPRSVDVQIGLRTDDRVEIISGVEEGDVVQAP